MGRIHKFQSQCAQVLQNIDPKASNSCSRRPFSLESEACPARNCRSSTFLHGSVDGHLRCQNMLLPFSHHSSHGKLMEIVEGMLCRCTYAYRDSTRSCKQHETIHNYFSATMYACTYVYSIRVSTIVYRS